MIDFISSPTEVVKVGEPLSNSDAITKALEKGELYKRGFDDGYKRGKEEQPTGGLISREALKEHKLPIPLIGDYQQGWNDAIDVIYDNAPTVPNEYMRGYEAAEREYKRPTGKWIMNKTSPRGRNYTCTHCKKISRNKSEYCPKCGATMEEAENEARN